MGVFAAGVFMRTAAGGGAHAHCLLLVNIAYITRRRAYVSHNAAYARTCFAPAGLHCCQYGALRCAARIMRSADSALTGVINNSTCCLPATAHLSPSHSRALYESVRWRDKTVAAYANAFQHILRSPRSQYRRVYHCIHPPHNAFFVPCYRGVTT